MTCAVHGFETRPLVAGSSPDMSIFAILWSNLFADYWETRN